MAEKQDKRTAPELTCGDPAAVRDDRADWQTPTLIVASARDTGNASNGGSDPGVFPAPDSAS